MTEKAGRMTREEAVARIKEHIEIHRYHERNAVKIIKALDMAIKALEQPEIIHCRECKHFNSYFVECDHENGLMYIFKDDHNYCSYAERREEGEQE